MAYGLSAAGSDWNEWRVRDVDTGEDLSDHLRWVKFSGASWAKDGSGFFTAATTRPRPARSFSRRTTSRSCSSTLWARRRRRTFLVYGRPDEKEWAFGGYRLRRRRVSADRRPAGHRAQEPPVLQVADGPRRPGRPLPGRLRRFLRLPGPRGERVLAPDRQRRPARARHRHRHHGPRPRELARGHPRSRRNAARRQPRRRALLRVLPQGRPHAGEGLRPGWFIRARGRPARPGFGGRLRRQAGLRRDLLRLHFLHFPDDPVPLRHRFWHERPLSAAKSRLRP